MAVTTTNVQNVMSGNGVTTTFPFSFRFTALDQIQVYRALGADALTSVPLSEYTIVPNGDYIGGYVVFYAAAPAVGTTIVVRRVVPLTQNLIIGNQDGFFPAAVTNALDTLALVDQEIRFDMLGVLRLPEGSAAPLPTAANRAGRLLSFDAAGNPSVTTTAPDFDIPFDVATRAAETAVAAASAAVGARVDVDAAATQTLAAANVAVPAAAQAVALSTHWSEVVSPVTISPESFFTTGPYNLGDVLPSGAPFANERLPAVRLDLARGGGSTIDMGSVV